MSDNEDPPSQKAALLDESESPQRPHRVGLLRKLFKRKKSESTNDDPQEDENASLLTSCPELDYDGERDTIVAHKGSLPVRLQPINATDSEDEDIEEEGDDDELEKSDSQSYRSDSSNDTDSENDAINSDENESDNDEGDHGPSSRSLYFQDRPLSIGHNSFSVGSGYSDDPNAESYIEESRKSTNGRIQGFGNTAVQDSEMVSPRTMRSRLKNYRENRMQKMEIGDSAIGRRSWKSNIHNAVVGIVEKLLPEENDQTAKQCQKHGVDDAPPRPPPGSVSLVAENVEPVWTKQRRILGNDEAYIVYLESELKNKGLELQSWRFRVEELEKEASRLKHAQNEADDSSQNSSSTDENEGTGDSEIEWQTGLEPKEGILINLGAEGSTGGATHGIVDEHERSHNNNFGTGNGCSVAPWDIDSDIPGKNDEQVKEGILIEIFGDDEPDVSDKRDEILRSPNDNRERECKLIDLSPVGSTNPTNEDNLGGTTTGTESVLAVITDDEEEDDDQSKSSEQNRTQHDDGKDDAILLMDTEAAANQ